MGEFDRVIAAITVLWGWRRLLVALIAGATSALALAPIFFVPILFITFPVFVWLLDGVVEPGPGKKRLGVHIQAFGIGWAFGFGYFLAGLYWIGFAFLVDADDYAWMLPFVAAAMPCGLALFTGLAAVIARLPGARGYGRCLVLAASWTAFESARGSIFTGFAWNRLGQALAGSDELIQGAAFAGDLGLTFGLIAVATTPATMADREGPSRRWRAGVIGLAVIAVAWIGGYFRLSMSQALSVDGVHIRIVQPAVAQAEKWRPENRSSIVGDFLELSDSATSPQTMGVEGVTHLIWPETALPLLLEQEPHVVAAIAALLPEGTSLLTGGVTTQTRPEGGRQFFNSVLAIDSEGRIRSKYHKRRLVPFGEFLPFQATLERWGLAQLTRLPGGFSAGDGGRVMSIGSGPPFAPLICYEIIFSGDVVESGEEKRPEWILNLTNDAWFGNSSGPHQHLAQARLRAVEEGVAVIRAANTGISAVIGPRGRIFERLELNQQGVLDSFLPQSIESTPYSKYGNLPTFLVMLLVILGFISLSYYKSKYSNMKA